jgi:pimeloyl-ACP methyl ester carboxylesterase
MEAALGVIRRDETRSVTMNVMVEHGSFRLDGSRLAYEVYGSGDRVLVYLHGLLLDNQMNRALARTLAARGNRVVLLDLLGHGSSDKPLRASEYRMDAYAHDVVGLLDHLDVERAVVGGVSLGAGVSLQVATHAPGRVQGLVIEMPVLEWAVPAAAMFFTPLLLVMHYAGTPAGWFAGMCRRIPRTRNDMLNSGLDTLSTRPEVVKAVLHGILTGPVTPTEEQRRAISAPTMVIAHGRDLIHPFSDAEALVELLPDGRLESARSILELRVAPGRLTGRIADFLDETWAAEPAPARTLRAAGRRQAAPRR